PLCEYGIRGACASSLRAQREDARGALAGAHEGDAGLRRASARPRVGRREAYDRGCHEGSAAAWATRGVAPRSDGTAGVKLLVRAVLLGGALSVPARASSALATLAPEVARGLKGANAPVVVASPLASDVPAPRGEDLAMRVAQLLAGRIGGA